MHITLNILSSSLIFANLFISFFFLSFFNVCEHIIMFDLCLFRGCLVSKFKHTFEHFKQHYTYFHALFHSHVYQKHPNNITQTPLPNTPIIKPKFRLKLSTKINGHKFFFFLFMSLQPYLLPYRFYYFL